MSSIDICHIFLEKKKTKRIVISHISNHISIKNIISKFWRLRKSISCHICIRNCILVFFKLFIDSRIGKFKNYQNSIYNGGAPILSKKFLQICNIIGAIRFNYLISCTTKHFAIHLKAIIKRTIIDIFLHFLGQLMSKCFHL